MWRTSLEFSNPNPCKIHIDNSLKIANFVIKKLAYSTNQCKLDGLRGKREIKDRMMHRLDIARRVTLDFGIYPLGERPRSRFKKFQRDIAVFRGSRINGIPIFVYIFVTERFSARVGSPISFGTDFSQWKCFLLNFPGCWCVYVLVIHAVYIGDFLWIIFCSWYKRKPYGVEQKIWTSIGILFLENECSFGLNKWFSK